MDIQLKRGFIDVCVLASMLRGDTYGYKLIKDVSPVITVSESTLYPILKRLEGSNCVSEYSDEHNGRLRKYYSLTEAGRERINLFLSEWDEIERVYCFIREESEYDKK